MYIIAQPGNQYVLDDSGKIKRFKNPKSARDFLRDIGIRKPEKEGLRIIPQSEAALESVA